MRIINWNISYIGDTIHKIEFLKTLITSDCCVILQEVKPRAYEHIKSAFKSEDIIFAGTQNRKSLSYCEVSLTFDNTNKIFKSLDYD